MRDRSLVLLTLLALTACGGEQEPAAATGPAYSVDPARVSVSGVSAGAYMATQFHVAHSGLVRGAGMIAGGPWGCARDSLNAALGECVKDASPDVAPLAAMAAEWAAGNGPGPIDSLAGLDGSSVWLFRSPGDEAMGLDLSRAAAAFYERFGAAVTLISDFETVHGVPTVDAGVACDSFEPPYLNACGYDAAGEMLSAIHAGEDGDLAPRGTAAGTLTTVAVPGAADASLLEEAYLYVPQVCADGERCGLHVFFHGCQMSSELQGDVVARGAGFNEWADSNRLLVLYPQVKSSRLAPMNPMGCFDWWGYTGSTYATRDGAQIRAVKAVMDELAGGSL